MATTVRPAALTHRPPSVTAAMLVLGFLAVTAMGGGVALIAGGGAAPPDDWLDEIPLLDSWLIPGLVLAVGFGVGAAIIAYSVLRRPPVTALGWLERWTHHHWSWTATILIGLGQVVWIGLELIFLPEFSLLEPLYGAVGLALMLLPFTAGMRAYLSSNR